MTVALMLYNKIKINRIVINRVPSDKLNSDYCDSPVKLQIALTHSNCDSFLSDKMASFFSISFVCRSNVQLKSGT